MGFLILRKMIEHDEGWEVGSRVKFLMKVWRRL